MKLSDLIRPMCKNCFEQGHEDGDCKIDREDLYQIDSIAAFIGARLNYVLPECNSGKRGGQLVSTIKLSQHKEKFFYARIYCELANEKLVQEKWLAERQRESDGETPPLGYVSLCFKNDAKHYRSCYISMIKLVPRLKHRIRSQADYDELLFDDEAEMRSELDELAKPVVGYPFDSLLNLRERYEVSTNEELKDALAKFY